MVRCEDCGTLVELPGGSEPHLCAECYYEQLARLKDEARELGVPLGKGDEGWRS